MKKAIILFIILCTSAVVVQSKTKKFGAWVELEFSKEFMKKFEFSIIPEVRFQDDFTVDEYMFDGKLAYKPIKFLKLAATYRIKTNVKPKGNEVTNRFAFDVSGKKGIGRFDASLRLRYTNYTDLGEGKFEDNYFRPRLKFVYDIKGNKIMPFVRYELFINETSKEFDKSRFDVGATRKIAKYGRIGLYYRLKNYFSDRNSINIVGIEYSLKI